MNSKRHLVTLLILAMVAVFATAVFVLRLPVINRLEALFYEWHARVVPPLSADSRIVIVGISDRSIDHLPLSRPSIPFSRTLHAKVLKELHDGGAKVVGMDMIFSREIPEEDRVLAGAILEMGWNRVLAGAEPLSSTIEPVLFEDRFIPISPQLAPFIRQASISFRMDHSASLWINPIGRYPHMSVGLAAEFLNVQPVMFADKAGSSESLKIGSINVPFDRSGTLLVPLVGPAGTFQPVPYEEVFSGEWRRTRGESFFKDKIVLIGVTDPLLDRHQTVLGGMQGVEILAQMTQQILTSNWMVRWYGASVLFGAALTLFVAAAVWKFGIRPALWVALIAACLWIVIAHETFVHRHIWIDTAEPLLAVAVFLVMAGAFEMFGVGHEKSV